MNKKLLALAVAAALAPAAAMADSGNVTIYGVMDVSYDITDNGNTATAQGIRTSKVSSNNGRIGFKGNEDMGNGVSAVWQVESTVFADQGGDTLGTRNTFVGLSSKTAGTAILGRHDTPYKVSTRAYDYFTDGLADNRNLMGKGQLGFDIRPSNVVAYISPNMSGFQATAAYVTGAEGAVTSGQQKGDAWSLSGNYANGPLTAALAYQRNKFGDATAAAPSTVVGGVVVPGAAATSTGSLGSATNTGKTEKAWKLGASYNFGALDVSGVYEKTSDDFVTGMDHKAYTLGAKYKIGSNDLKLAYTKAGDAGDVSQTGAKQWALGVDHNMSKRTKVFAQYVKLSNDTAASYGLTGAAASGAVAAKGADADPSAWSFGMRHSF